MANWATIEEAAKHLRMAAGSLRNKISKDESFAKLFIDKDGFKRIVDLDDLDLYLKGEVR